MRLHYTWPVCALGYIDIVRLLMSFNADIHKRDSYNNAPIHRAVAQGHGNIMNALITEYSCDPMIRGFQKRTLLHFACSTGKLKLVNALIHKFGIDPMSGDSQNVSPLHIAAMSGQEETVSLLLTTHKCLINARNSVKETSLCMFLWPC